VSTPELPDVYAGLGVRRVINASGKMTALGGSAVSEEVASAIAAAARSHVSMEKLTTRAGAIIAGYAGAEAACLTSGAAAGIVQMTAACIAGVDQVRVERLPDVDGDRRDVLLQTGHAVSFGAPVTQMIRIGGGRPVTVGWANAVSKAQLEGSIDARTAAFLYVQSHHAVQEGMLPLATCVAICHARGIPVLVDAAAEDEIGAYITIGADLVAYSGGKAFGGPTSGFVVGKRELIRACRAQERGVARPMKVGKEQVVGLLTALAAHARRDHGRELARNRQIADHLVELLTGIPETTIGVAWDEAGRAIPRAVLTFRTEQPGTAATALLAHLRNGDPPIYLRGHAAGLGSVAIDPRPLDEVDVPIVVERIKAFFRGARLRPE